jgi:PAS domain S-box-containing protein
MTGRSLLSRVLLVVVIALLPGLALQVYTERQDRLTRQSLMQDQVLRSLHVITDAERRILDGSALVLDTISASPSVQDQDVAACTRLMDNLVATAPRYLGAALLSLDGHRVCGSGSGGAHMGSVDRPYFRRALQAGAFAVGDYALGRSSGKPSLQFAQPVRDANGAVRGVVFVSLSLAWLQTQLEGLALPDDAAAAIVDRNGTVLAHVPADPGLVGRTLNEQKRFVLEGSAIRMTHALNRFGRDQLLAYQPPGAGPSGLAVMVGVDAATAYAAVTDGNRFRLWLIVTTSLVALLLTILFGRRLIDRPVARLLAAAERWRAGDLAARSELRQDFSEFGRLAAAFDGMAATLQARQHALNMALESTPDGVVVFDRQWRYVYTNARARAMNGVDRVGRIVWEDTPEAIGTPAAAALREAMRTGEPTQVDGYAVTHKKHLQINAYPSADGLTVFFRDLTEERRTAAALRDSEARLQLACEVAGFGIWERDCLAGTRTWSVDQWRLFGLRPQEAPPDRATFEACIHPDDLERLKADRWSFRAGGADTFTTEYRVVWPDGSVHWLNDRARRIRAPDGTSHRSIGVTFDVTERREAEEQLRQLSAELREAHRIAHLGNWHFDAARGSTVVSDEVCRILGLDPQAPVPRRFAQRGTIYPADAWEIVNAAIERALATGEGFDLDLRAWRGSEPIWVNVRAEALRARDGAVTGLRGTLQDITERRRLEDELRSLTKTLELRIEQEVAAREAAQVRAAQAERIQALGQLAGGIAHDFNNVLQATMGGLSLIERRLHDPDGIRRIARMARDACERGASITRRLLSFARQGELRAGLVDLAELLAGLQEILAHTLGVGIEVHVAVSDGLRPAFVDRSQLETVLVNLATNARDAMPGGGRLIFSAAAETFREGPPHVGLPSGAYVRLAVTDTGQGMEEATLARAAEPFFTTKRHGEGTGLGLSMAKGFVEQSGGAMAITSAPGEGTTITLWLPEAAPGQALARAPDAGAPDADAARGRKRVLLVDDQESVRDILAAQLQDAGFDVVPAAGGAQAIAMLAGGLTVDALVSDLSMPQIDGLAVISAAQQRMPHLPAILLTGYAGDDTGLAVSGAIEGSFSLLRKPVEETHLVDRLSALLAAADALRARADDVELEASHSA